MTTERTTATMTSPTGRWPPLLQALTDHLPATRRELRALDGAVHDRLATLTLTITTLEDRMTTTEDDQYARALEVAGLIRAEFASLHTQLDAALADRDAAVAAGVESALNADTIADTKRIKGLIDEFVATIPGTVPDVPVPDPGEPAVLPTPEPGPDPDLDDGTV